MTHRGQRSQEAMLVREERNRIRETAQYVLSKSFWDRELAESVNMVNGVSEALPGLFMFLEKGEVLIDSRGRGSFTGRLRRQKVRRVDHFVSEVVCESLFSSDVDMGNEYFHYKFGTEEGDKKHG